MKKDRIKSKAWDIAVARLVEEILETTRSSSEALHALSLEMLALAKHALARDEQFTSGQANCTEAEFDIEMRDYTLQLYGMSQYQRQLISQFEDGKTRLRYLNEIISNHQTV